MKIIKALAKRIGSGFILSVPQRHKIGSLELIQVVV